MAMAISLEKKLGEIPFDMIYANPVVIDKPPATLDNINRKNRVFSGLQRCVHPAKKFKIRFPAHKITARQETAFKLLGTPEIVTGIYSADEETPARQPDR